MTSVPDPKQWLWHWGGGCFGYREVLDLWTYDGQHVARFHGVEVYDRYGAYLGEVRRTNRLIVDVAKLGQHHMVFSPKARRQHETPPAPAAALTLPAHHLEFPSL